jgi:hypothetical protein
VFWSALVAIWVVYNTLILGGRLDRWLGATPRHSVAWLRDCATSRKVAGSIPDEVKQFFQFT